MDKLKLTGAILGVSFDVTVQHEEIDDGGKIIVTGEAWGMPVDITFVAGEMTLSASGTLLGNEFTIDAAKAE